MKARNWIKRKGIVLVTTRKTLGKNKGLVIAFIGQDGAGKSTVTKDTLKWLNWKLDANQLYMGSGDDYKSFLKSARIYLSSKRNPLAKKCSQALTAIEFRRLGRKIRKNSETACRIGERGGIVIFDRYPQMQFFGNNDGPRIRYNLEKHSKPSIVNKILMKLAIEEEHDYKKAINNPPDIIFKLLLDPKVSIERKPLESYEDVCQKHMIVKQLNYPSAKVIEIDATMDFDEEIILIRNEIWTIFLEKQMDK